MSSEREQALRTRAAVDRFVDNLRSDSDYASRYRDDPVGVLVAEGLPPESIAQILQEDSFGADDVAGFAANYPSIVPSLGAGTHVGGGLGWCPCTQCCCTDCCATVTF